MIPFPPPAREDATLAIAAFGFLGPFRLGSLTIATTVTTTTATTAAAACLRLFFGLGIITRSFGLVGQIGDNSIRSASTTRGYGLPIRTFPSQNRGLVIIPIVFFPLKPTLLQKEPPDCKRHCSSEDSEDSDYSFGEIFGVCVWVPFFESLGHCSVDWSA